MNLLTTVQRYCHEQCVLVGALIPTNRKLHLSVAIPVRWRPFARGGSIREIDPAPNGPRLPGDIIGSSASFALENVFKPLFFAFHHLFQLDNFGRSIGQALCLLQ
jgi:hypothetical protein